MSSDEKETSGGAFGGDGGAASPKRPSRTIELEAEEVEIETRDAESGGDAGEDGGSDETGPEDSIAAESEDGDTKAAGENGLAGEPGKADAGSGPPPPPQRARPSEIKGFVTHLAAGLAGGLIGVVGAGVGLDKLPLSNLTGGFGAGGKSAQIEERLDEITATLQEQEKALAASAKSDAVAKLDSRVAAVEAKPPAETAVPDEIGARLARLEETLKALQTAGGEPGSTGLEQSAALTAKIDAVEEEAGKQVAALKQDIAEAKQAIADRPEPPAASPEAVKALERRLAALEEKTAALAEQPVSSAPQPASNAAALTLAFESLRRAAERGEPYATQLEALGKLAAGDPGLSALAAHAATGAASESALLGALPKVLSEARSAAAKSGGETFLGRLASNAQSVVRVRRIGPVEGESADAVLSRMEARMNASDLAGVVAEAGGLNGAALESVRPWLDKAAARRGLDTALAAIEARLLAGLAGDAEAQR